MGVEDAGQGAGGKLDPCQVFTVPDGVRHMDGAQLARMETSFRHWCEATPRADVRRSRERMRLFFLLVRYSGARLGEVVGLDDARDLDLERREAVFGAPGHERTVPLPQGLCRELRIFLEGPMGASLRGKAFVMDSGYVRRVFYARAEDCGVPRELASPRILRASRAVELLRSGVPLTVVRDVLGQSSTDLTAVFQAYTSEDAQHIVRRLAPDDLPLRTSARNTFPCRVESVLRDGVMAEVRLATYGGLPLYAIITAESALNLGLGPGVPVAATIKAPLVEVVCADRNTGSARNSFAAVLTDVRRTEIVAEVVGESAEGVSLCALVSSASLDELGVGPGDLVQFRFKAMAVVLNAL
ncbi:TOBE domain-containing protein [Desulfocurvus sp. DL9XJH121]